MSFFRFPRADDAPLTRLLLLASLMFAGCGGESSDPKSPPFRAGTTEMGINFVHSLHHAGDGECDYADRSGPPGVCAFDYDGDGDVDLYFTDRSPNPNRLYRNDGGSFTDVTEESGAGDTADSVGCSVFDYDADGDHDLLVLNNGPVHLLRNDGGVFSDVTSEVGLESVGFHTTASAGDIDGDGDLDLALGSFSDISTCTNALCEGVAECVPDGPTLWVNDGGTFVNESTARGIAYDELTLVVLFVDFDSDGDMDLFVGNDSGNLFPDHLYLNDGTGYFTDDESTGIKHMGTATMGVAVGDLDGNGVDDMLITDWVAVPTRKFLCEAGPSCVMYSLNTESADYVDWGIGTYDFDGDGDLDVYQASGSPNGFPFPAGPAVPNSLHWNDGEANFSRYVPAGTDDPLAQAAMSRSVAFGDLNEDGAIDVVVGNAGDPPQILVNDVFEGNHLIVQLDTLSLGARVTVRSGDRTQSRQQTNSEGFAGSSDPRLYFSLGSEQAAEVTVEWLDGQSTIVTASANSVLRVDRP